MRWLVRHPQSAWLTLHWGRWYWRRFRERISAGNPGIFLNAAASSGLQFHHVFFFVNQVNGAEKFETSISRSQGTIGFVLTVCDSGQFATALTLSESVRISTQFIICPKYLSWSMQECHLFIFRQRRALWRWWKTSMSRHKCSSVGSVDEDNIA